MSKFNTTAARPAVSSPIASEVSPSGRTHEGGDGYARSAKSELFLLAVTNMVGENSFYENAGSRDSRYADLVRTVTHDDPEWTAAFLRWLRTDGNMRSASLVGACEFAKARLDARQHGMSRQVIASVCQRADEPGEVLAYWTSTYGRTIPKPVKRGVADAVQRLYDERSFAKWDSDARGFRMADVIDLTHPLPRAPWQGDLYAHILDRRHGNADGVPESLPILRARASWSERVKADPSIATDPDEIRAAGFTWENVLSSVGDGDKRAAWEAVIPSMGFMALLRNLRNFDQAGVSDTVAQTVAERLADHGEVARSRQFPLRFLSAYNAAPSLRWSYPLEKALDASLSNIPRLKGRTLVLVDTSSSMHDTFSRDGSLMRWDAAAVFGIALGARCEDADVVSFSSAQCYVNDPAGARTSQFPMQRGESLLRSVKRWKDDGYFLGGGTDTPGALRKHFDRHDRVVILTDEQAMHGTVGDHLPATPIYTWNLAGYQYGHAPSGGRNRHTFAGLTDAGFRMIPLLESGRDGTWPWNSSPSSE